MPNPGRKFASTTKSAFFPMSTEGIRVVDTLQQAFNARLLFTVKPSTDPATDDELVWNGVCHKTNVFGGPQQYVRSLFNDYYLHRGGNVIYGVCLCLSVCLSVGLLATFCKNYRSGFRENFAGDSDSADFIDEANPARTG